MPNGPKSTWQYKNQDIMSLKQEKENAKREVEYVKTLDNWEKNFLPKIK